MAALREPDGVGLRRSRLRRPDRGRVRRGPLAAAGGLRGRGQDARGHHGARQRERGSDGGFRGRADARRAAARDAPERCARERARVRRSRGAVRDARRLRSRAPPEAPGVRRSRRARGAAAEGPVRLGAASSARRTVWRSRSTTRTRSTSLRRRCSRSWRARRQGHRLFVAATAETGAARGDSAALEVLAERLDEDRAARR